MCHITIKWQVQWVTFQIERKFLPFKTKGFFLFMLTPPMDEEPEPSPATGFRVRVQCSHTVSQLLHRFAGKDLLHTRLYFYTNGNIDWSKKAEDLQPTASIQLFDRTLATRIETVLTGLHEDGQRALEDTERFIIFRLRHISAWEVWDAISNLELRCAIMDREMQNLRQRLPPPS